MTAPLTEVRANFREHCLDYRFSAKNRHTCALHLACTAEDATPAIASSLGDTHNHISMSLALAAVC